jgi:hypothetical protein
LGIAACNNISNFDIAKALKKNLHFRGVYPRDLLPKRIANDECGVINLDISSGSGTHWVGYYNDSRLDYVEYFDPFGEYDKKRVCIPKEIVRYLRSGSKQKIMYNDAFIQKVDSAKCGCFVIKYIKLRESGLNPKETLAKFTEYPSNYNEKFVLKF